MALSPLYVYGFNWGGQKPTGVTLKLFGLSFPLWVMRFYCCARNAWYASTPTSKVENSSQVLFSLFKFVHDLALFLSGLINDPNLYLSKLSTVTKGFYGELKN
jgi:hypothetical protein